VYSMYVALVSILAIVKVKGKECVVAKLFSYTTIPVCNDDD
jgi:hypothetical protein